MKEVQLRSCGFVESDVDTNMIKVSKAGKTRLWDRGCMGVFFVLCGGQILVLIQVMIVVFGLNSAICFPTAALLLLLPATVVCTTDGLDSTRTRPGSGNA